MFIVRWQADGMQLNHRSEPQTEQ